MIPMRHWPVKSVDMEATIKTVRSMTLPELNDDFAKMVGQYENSDALKEALAKDIEAARPCRIR